MHACIYVHMSVRMYVCMYGTAHVQVYKQTHVMHHASRNFEDNSSVGLIRHEEYTAHERSLMS